MYIKKKKLKKIDVSELYTYLIIIIILTELINLNRKICKYIGLVTNMRDKPYFKMKNC